MLKPILVVFSILLTSACSSWVYKFDISQGNFLNQDDVDKLRVNMTKEQVDYVLGSPVATSAFKDDSWHYVYLLKSGKTDKTSRTELIVKFENDKLVALLGDFKEPENFETPLEGN